MDWWTELDRWAADYLPDLRMAHNEPMRLHTSFRVGGPARRMAFPETESELAALLDLAAREGYPYTVIGNGSNVLSPDEGLDRLVINTSRVDTVTVVGNAVHALAGATMARVANAAQRAGLTGMEFAHGIPGTLGGGVFMNAGAYGGELCQVVRSVRAWFPGEGIVTLEHIGRNQHGDVVARAVRKTLVRKRPESDGSAGGGEGSAGAAHPHGSRPAPRCCSVRRTARSGTARRRTVLTW